MTLSRNRDVPAAGMLLLLGAGKGMLPSVTQPVAHGLLVVLTDLIQWPTTGLERIKPDTIPTTWLQLVGSGSFCRHLVLHPLPSTRQQKKNGVFVSSLDGLVIHVSVDWHGHPGAGGCLGAQHCPGLERAGIRHPLLQPLPRVPGGIRGPE